jgi:methylenetetrahydrofolate dehydrogenase (NAD+)
MAEASSVPCKTVLASRIAESLLAEVKEGLAQLEQVPHLVGFLANTDPAGKTYADFTAKTCKEKFVFSLIWTSKSSLHGSTLVG